MSLFKLLLDSPILSPLRRNLTDYRTVDELVNQLKEKKKEYNNRVKLNVKSKISLTTLQDEGIEFLIKNKGEGNYDGGHDLEFKFIKKYNDLTYEVTITRKKPTEGNEEVQVKIIANHNCYGEGHIAKFNHQPGSGEWSKVGNAQIGSNNNFCRKALENIEYHVPGVLEKILNTKLIY